MLEVLAVPAALLGASAAGYTAMLFAQCEGRDLWQTPLLLPLLLARAVVAGAAAYAVVDLVITVPSARAVWWALLGGVAAVGFLTLVELGAHGTRHVELALHAMTRGAQAGLFRAGVALGVIVPGALVVVALATDAGGTALVAVAGVSAVTGMLLSETAFVRAGQSVPLS